MIEMPWRTRYIEDANYFRLAYQLAAMQLNAALGSRAVMIDGRMTSRAELLKNSANSARLVAAEAGVLLERYDRRSKHRDWWRPWRQRKLKPAERRLERFLGRTVKPSASLVLAGALCQQGYVDEGDQIASRIRAFPGKDGLSYRAYYNLACYEASQGRGGTVNVGNCGFAVALEDLRQALRVVHGARLTELIRWAGKDPSLKGLAGDKEYGPRFRDMLARYEIPQPTGKTGSKKQSRKKPGPGKPNATEQPN